ncbi:MAG: hypothetical protein FWD87_05760 [Spirochaetaceae bacterium]|nr:hypothetical protein [Spirochaetaceae bacterium]
MENEKKLKVLANQGDPQAQFELAKLYLEKKDLHLFFKWIKMAVEQGHEDAENCWDQYKERMEKTSSGLFLSTLF